MVSLNDKILLNSKNQISMSMGFLIEEGSPVIWRGLMVMQALEKLMRGVSWGPVDYLIIDTPPGTGDTHLSLVQNLPIDGNFITFLQNFFVNIYFLLGVLLVTTPQNAALNVAKRGAVMFKKLNVPIIGLLENMSSIDCPKCANSIKLFGSKTDELSQDIDVPIIGRIPLENEIADCSDNGTPIVITNPEHRQSVIYKDLATKIVQFVK